MVPLLTIVLYSMFFFDKSVVDSRLRFGFSSIGIDVGHTHGHAQTNGIGELFPCFYIAADFVVLSQNLINGILMFFGSRGKLFQYFPRIFEIDEQGSRKFDPSVRK